MNFPSIEHLTLPDLIIYKLSPVSPSLIITLLLKTCKTRVSKIFCFLSVSKVKKSSHFSKKFLFSLYFFNAMIFKVSLKCSLFNPQSSTASCVTTVAVLVVLCINAISPIIPPLETIPAFFPFTITSTWPFAIINI